MKMEQSVKMRRAAGRGRNGGNQETGEESLFPMETHTLHLNLRTTVHVMRYSSLTFFSTLLTCFCLSFLLFSFRNAVYSGTFFLTSFIDSDPSLQSLISRISSDSPPHIPATPLRSPIAGTHHRLRRRRRPFLHLSRVGTLDDDFFSDDVDDDRSLFSFPRHAGTHSNGTFRRFRPFLPPDKVDGIRVLEIGRSGFVFEEDSGESNSSTDYDDHPSDFQLFGRGFNLDRHETARLLFFLAILSAAYGWMILGFLFTYCFVLGTVFVAVVYSILGRPTSVLRNIRTGFRLGLRRSLGFLLLRWAVRDAITQFLGIWFFSDIQDQFSLFKLFLRLKLLPFSVSSSSPWMGPAGLNTHVSGFLFTWALLDTFISLVFAVNCWVATTGTRRDAHETLKEGCYLISIMFNQAVKIKCLESIFCGAVVRWIIARVGGDVFALFFQSVVEVYFMVVWLIFYFSARAKEAELDGRRFGRRDLEDYISGIR